MRATPASRSLAAAGLALVVAAFAGCATLRPAPPGAAESLRAAATFTGRLRVSVRRHGLRGGVTALVGYRRPDALRVEIPGPMGARLIAVARDGRLTAVFPAERAVYEGPATDAGMEALLGIALTPQEVIALLSAQWSPRLRYFRVGWGPVLPSRLIAGLPDGTRLQVDVQEGEAGVEIPARAFDTPEHVGYRAIDVDEARSLWTGR